MESILCGNIMTLWELMLWADCKYCQICSKALNRARLVCLLHFKDGGYFNVCLPTLCYVKKQTKKKQILKHLSSMEVFAVAIATISIHSFLVSSGVHRVRAALDSPDWTRLGPYHAGRRGGRKESLKSTCNVTIVFFKKNTFQSFDWRRRKHNAGDALRLCCQREQSW